MEQTLKQRLVGALVITALAAIFVPMLFEDPTDKSSRETDLSDLAIPAAPVQNFSEDNPIPRNPQQVLQVHEQDAAAEPPEEESEAFDEAPEEQALQEEDTLPETEPVASPPQQWRAEKRAVPQPQPPAAKPKQLQPTPEPPVRSSPLKRWVVQLGSFSQKTNADALVNKLRTQGFNAYSDSIQVAGKGTMYRVRIGPELDKKRAQAMQKKLQQSSGSSGMLMTE
ncbi:MAG: SPOR domain-containing protein [Gammaproteobacteria bacterium]